MKFHYAEADVVEILPYKQSIYYEVMLTSVVIKFDQLEEEKREWTHFALLFNKTIEEIPPLNTRIRIFGGMANNRFICNYYEILHSFITAKTGTRNLEDIIKVYLEQKKSFSCTDLENNFLFFNIQDSKKILKSLKENLEKYMEPIQAKIILKECKEQLVVQTRKKIPWNQILKYANKQKFLTEPLFNQKFPKLKYSFIKVNYKKSCPQLDQYINF